jgi:RES domain
VEHDATKMQSHDTSVTFPRMANPGKAFVFCSNCFRNEGLRIEAEKLGQRQESPCPACSSTSGKKIDEGLLWELCRRFFDYGSRSLYQPPAYRIIPPSLGPQFKGYEVKFDTSLSDDAARIKQSADIGLRYNAPNIRRMGITSVYHEIWTILDSDTLTDNAKAEKLADTFARVRDCCGSLTLVSGQKMYRIRINPDGVSQPTDFDTTPIEFRKEFRFNSVTFPVWYAGLEIETCIHECRARAGDEIILATLTVEQPQRIIDLDNILTGESRSEERSEVYFFLMALLNSQYWRDYRVLQLFAEFIKRSGFDGLKYRSFYSAVRGREYSNIALFGFPIKERRISFHSMNRIRLERVAYEYVFGPVIHTLWDEAERNRSSK